MEKEFNVTLRPEESAFVALFLCEDGEETNDTRRPAVLIAMHGRGVASGIAAVVRSISGGEITAYDMDLDKDLQLVYSELKTAFWSVTASAAFLPFMTWAASSRCLR